MPCMHRKKKEKRKNTEGSHAKITEGLCVLSLFFLLVRLFPPLYDEHKMTYIEIEKINKNLNKN